MSENSIGQEILTLRKQALMTIPQLAAKCGVSVTYISMVERGVCNPTDIMKNRIFNAFVV
ncbi:MAG TPA: helix-turn-helix transcriptional regulator [Chitinophagaceae bacterium]|nr:helix-turn-helix transcriptional regulator [Chitinophagaceae bacterium]